MSEIKETMNANIDNVDGIIEGQQPGFPEEVLAELTPVQSEDTGGADLIEQPSMDEPTEETDLEHSDIDDEPEFMDDKDTDSVPEPEYMEEDPPFASSPKSAGLPDSIIGSYHQHPTVDVPEQAPSGMNVRERSDRAAKQRAVANQTGGVTNRPGAVAVSPTTTPSVSSPIARDSQDATANHMPGSDSFIKARAGRSGTKVPGAVSVEPTHVAPPPTSVMSQGDEDEMSKARSARPSRLHDQHQHQQQHSATYIASQTEQDAEAKARARGSVGNTSPIQPGAVGVGQSVDMESVDESHDFDQMARRREDRALARADRLGMRDSSVGAVLVTPTESTAESRKMEQDSKRGFVMSTPSNGAATTSHESTPVFSQMPEEERQRRFDAKMAQMNQGHQDSREKRGTDQSIATTNSAVFSNMSEDDREHRFDVKMAQMDQQHDDNREKHAAAIDLEDDPLYERRHQPTSLRSNGNPDKFDHIDPMDSNPSATGITTTADRGMAVAPDVEYGEYTQPRVNDNDLVVAIAIDEEEEEEDEKLYAYAVEYDPNSKPPLYQNRRCRLYGIIGAVGFLVLVIVLIVSVVATKNNVVVSTFAPSVSPTLSPTSALESAYRSVFAQAVSEKVYEQGTPHYSAANWIIYDDPMKLEETHPNLLQRYMMAFLYFHTTENGTKEWRSCNPPKDGEDDTCEFMEFVRMQDDSIAYVPRSGLTRWLSGLDECSWVGVECAGGPAILGFRLFGQNLTGTLPTELAALPLLQRISVPYNDMTGTLPAEYATLRHLLDLEVHGNMLTGSIPVEYFEKDTLTLINFNIGENLLSGTLDTRIGLMTDLKGLHIFENNFRGNFPSEVGNLPYLSFSRVNGNEFAGPLPTELGNLGQLSEFWFHQNTFSGTIPSELGLLVRLKDFRIWGNRMRGKIPDELFNMTKLYWFSVREMALTGTLSTLVSQLTDLQALEVSTNQLTGTIPTEIQNMTALGLAWLHYNQFTGQVPDEICTLGLEVLQADCNPVDNPPNFCRCCSACCDRDLKTCLTVN